MADSARKTSSPALFLMDFGDTPRDDGFALPAYSHKVDRQLLNDALFQFRYRSYRAQLMGNTSPLTAQVYAEATDRNPAIVCTQENSPWEGVKNKVKALFGSPPASSTHYECHDAQDPKNNAVSDVVFDPKEASWRMVFPDDKVGVALPLNYQPRNQDLLNYALFHAQQHYDYPERGKTRQDSGYWGSHAPIAEIYRADGNGAAAVLCTVETPNLLGYNNGIKEILGKQAVEEKDTQVTFECHDAVNPQLQANFVRGQLKGNSR